MKDSLNEKGTWEETMNTEIPKPAEDKCTQKRVRKVTSKSQAVRNSDLANVGKILPNCPTTAEDLVEQWSIPASEAMGVRVNVLLQRPGDLNPQLMCTVPALEYDMEKLAGDFGPGLYFIKGNPHRWAVHSARFEVSEAFARRAGYGRIPTRAADALAVRTLQDATKGPSDPVELIAAVEALLDRKLAERGQVVQAQPAMMNPAVAMQTQAESMMSFLGVMDQMESRMMAIAERRAGLRPLDEAVPESSTFLELAKAFAPHVGPILSGLFGRMTNGPASERQRPAMPSGTPALPNSATQPAPAAPGAPVEQPMNPTGPLPALNSDESAAIAPAVRMLKPYTGMLAQVARDANQTDSQIAAGLSSYIGPAAWGYMLSLAELVRVKGRGVLGYIGPELMESDRWPNILQELAAMIREWMKEDGGAE
jgi:hypothetical protein